jgi:hypothetical protein
MGRYGPTGNQARGHATAGGTGWGGVGGYTRWERGSGDLGSGIGDWGSGVKMVRGEVCVCVGGCMGLKKGVWICRLAVCIYVCLSRWMDGERPRYKRDFIWVWR